MEKLIKQIEALIFSSEQPITLLEIKDCLVRLHESDINIKQLEYFIQELITRYENGNYAFKIAKIGGGYQFLTKNEHHKLLTIYHQTRQSKRLSTAAMETLAIIAYRQPVEKADIEHIRGVNCDYTLQKLLEKELITIIGRADGPGKPILYGTSDLFMEYFGINSVSDLPKLKELKPEENMIGTAEFEFAGN